MTKVKIWQCLFVAWLVWAIAYILVIHPTADKIGVVIYVSSIVLELFGNDMYGVVNLFVIPWLVDLFIGSAALFLSFLAFLSIQYRGLRVSLRTILVVVGLIAVMLGLAAGERNFVSTWRVLLFFLVTLVVMTVSIWSISKIVLSDEKSVNKA